MIATEQHLSLLRSFGGIGCTIPRVLTRGFDPGLLRRHEQPSRLGCSLTQVMCVSWRWYLMTQHCLLAKQWHKNGCFIGRVVLPV